MRFIECPIRGAWVVEPTPRGDERGWFARVWCAREFAEHGIMFTPVQANMAASIQAGTVRGMHYQIAPHLEAKVMRCTRGRVFDVLVDVRPDSPTYGDWFGTELTADDGRMLYVPPLCAHGYQTLTADAEIHYLTSAEYAPVAVRGVRFDDPQVGIRWPLPPQAVSDQDRAWPPLGAPERAAS